MDTQDNSKDDSKIQSRLERTKAYTLEQIFEKVQASSDLTWELVRRAGALLKPGMTESEATLEIQKLFEEASKVGKPS